MCDVFGVPIVTGDVCMESLFSLFFHLILLFHMNERVAKKMQNVVAKQQNGNDRIWTVEYNEYASECVCVFGFIQHSWRKSVVHGITSPMNQIDFTVICDCACVRFLISTVSYQCTSLLDGRSSCIYCVCVLKRRNSQFPQRNSNTLHEYYTTKKRSYMNSKSSWCLQILMT